MLGTIMVANVWMRILPAQQKMIDATSEGRTPDFTLSDRAKRRSVHNSYMTFPVLFIMLSNHFPALYGAPQNALVLVLLMVAGASARHVMIGKGPSRSWAGGAVALGLAGAFLLARPAAGMKVPAASAAAGPTPSFAEVQAIVQARCVACHSKTPRDATFGVAPAGVSFDDPAEIRGSHPGSTSAPWSRRRCRSRTRPGRPRRSARCWVAGSSMGLRLTEAGLRGLDTAVRAVTSRPVTSGSDAQLSL
jgi:uncharacterized membrane protein